MTSVSLGYSLLGIVLLFFAVVWWGCSKYNKSEAGYCRFASSYSACWGLGAILVSLRSEIWDWLGYSLSSFVFIVGFVCLFRSIERLYKLSESRLQGWGILLISGLLLIVIGPDSANQSLRLMLLGVVSAYCCVLALVKSFTLLWRKNGLSVAVIMALVGGFAIVLWMLRLPMGLQSHEELNVVMDSTFNLSALYLSWMIAICFQGAALYLMMSRFARKKERLATMDYLTGAYNRLGLKNSWLKMMPHRGSGCLLILDIDHFKKINDTYGHDFGDAVLKLVVQRINNCIRKGDVVSRYGGEEFVVLLPGSELGYGYRLAERIRESIENDPLELSGQQVNVTVSIGIVGLGIGEDDIDILITQADRALYQAKEQGRNQVVVAGTDF